MTDQTEAKKQVLDEIINRNSMGDKKYHSETSLQQFGDEEEGSGEDVGSKDPGVRLFNIQVHKWVQFFIKICTKPFIVIPNGKYCKKQILLPLKIKLLFFFCKINIKFVAWLNQGSNTVQMV